MLQSVDDLELETLLPNTINEAYRTWLGSGTTCKFSMIDLGCGTGRNTAKLLALWSAFQNKSTEIDVTALDFSRGMLDVARQKLKAGENIKLHLEQADCFPTVANEAASPVPHVEGLTPAWLVISTLVLEHIPLKDYFKTLAALVNKGGYALVTNMHSDMGRISQAGFVNAQGVKVRGTSFAFTPEETVEAAQEAGFKVLSIKETEMETSMIQSGRVGERGNKWLGIKVWYGLVLVKE
jgi:SAM-dependent methyltransferase